MKATITDIIPGKILYKVFFLPRLGCDSARIECKVIVTSCVNANNNINSACFNCIDDYNGFGYDYEIKDSHHFLGDVGMGKHIYNMHRLFTTKESALNYVAECRKGVFSDPLDQGQFDEEVIESPYDDDFMW